MASADVVVVGAGLAGLTAAVSLAQAGARVQVLARGHAATHWTAGTLDVAGPAAAATARDGVARLRAVPGHPYAAVAEDLAPALAWIRDLLASAGLPYAGDLDTPLRPLPTALGRTRIASIVPGAQAAALAPWHPGERLVVCGPTDFKDFQPELVAAGLERRAVWRGEPGPERVAGVGVQLPGVAGLRNLDALRLARLFDDREWRRSALARIGRAVNAGAGGVARRIAMPAVLGLEAHPDVLADARDALGDVFEIPLVPPSVPGLRLYRVLRAALLRAGGRIQIGEPVTRVEVADGAIRAVAVPAAARELRVRTSTLVLATGGIAGGGLVATSEGALSEPVLGLPVEQPPRRAWLAPDPFDPAGHLLEAAGIRTDADLRPLDAVGRLAGPRDVRVIGSALAGQRYLRERCGEGMAIASGWRAARLLAGAAGGTRPSAHAMPVPQAGGAAGALPAAAGAGTRAGGGPTDVR